MKEKLNVNENCMFGMGFPFFLNNANLRNSYYYYELYSPKLSPELIPYISLSKTYEKTVSEPWGHGSDILAMCIGNKKDLVATGTDLVRDILAKQDTVVEENGREFPLIEMREGNDIQKALVLGLRDSLRWKLYRFQAGRQVDVLWTPTEFVVFNICGDDNEIWFEPSGVYKMTDLEMKNPLKVDLKRIEYPKEKFERRGGKISEVNRMLKALEWKSFRRDSFVK